MKIAPRLVGINNLSPHANYNFPITPTFVGGGTDINGIRLVGVGSQYPHAAPLGTSIRQYCRPQRLFLRKGSFLSVVGRLPGVMGIVRRIELGSAVGPERERDNVTAIAKVQSDLACPYTATVTDVFMEGTTGVVEHQVTGFYGIFPSLRVLQGAKLPLWKEEALTYIQQLASISSYSFEDVATNAIASWRPHNGGGNCDPEERYEQVGTCFVDMRDQLKNGDDQKLNFEFPMYRDVWTEDGNFPAECGGPTLGTAWETTGAELHVCYVGWDKPDNIIPESAGTDELGSL